MSQEEAYIESSLQGRRRESSGSGVHPVGRLKFKYREGTMSKEKLERVVEFSPAFDKRHTDPAKNYGIGAVVCRMILKGKDLAVQFVFSTGMYLPSIVDEVKGHRKWVPEQMAYDLGHHSAKRQYKGQTICREKCAYLGGRPCYYGGSGLNAMPYLDVLINEGSEAVWKKLEAYYRQCK